MKVTEFLNNFAISSDGIATALQDSASALMAANNSYEEAVALIASANRVVQDPNSVGAALRTISLRLRGTSVEELEEAGEDTTGAVTSKSKLRSKVKTLSGVDILTDTGAYKSTYEILLDISRVWKDMSDVNQAALLEILAGKNRANTAAAILANTTDLEEAYTQALEAEGSALKENETYLDSIQGKIDLFTNALQNFWNNLLDDEAIKWIVSLGTEILKLASTFGELRTVLFLTFTYLNLSKKADFASWTVNFISKLSGALSKLEKQSKTTKKIVDDVNKAAATIDSKPTAKSTPKETKATKQKLLGAGTDETKSTEKSASKFSQIWQHHIQRVKNSFNIIKQGFTNIWQHHNERVAQSVQYASGQLNKLKTFASNTFGAMSKAIGNVTNNIKNAFGSLFNRTKMANTPQSITPYVDEETKQANRFSQIWQNHIARLRDSFNRVKQDISDTWQHHNERVAGSVQYAGTQFNKLKTAASNVFNNIANSVSNTINNIRAKFGQIADIMKAKVSVAPQKTTTTTSVSTNASKKPTDYTAQDTSQSTGFEQMFNKNMWQRHMDRVRASVQKVKADISSIWEHHNVRVEQSMVYASKQFDKLKSAVTQKVQGIAQTIGNIATNIRNIFAAKNVSNPTIPTQVQSGQVIPYGSSSVEQTPEKQTGSSTASFDSNKLLGEGEKTASKFSQIWQHHIERLKGSLDTLKKAFSTLWKHHTDRMSESVKHVNSQFNRLKGSISNIIRGFTASLGKIKSVFGKRNKVATIDVEDTTSKSSTKDFSGRIKNMQAEFNRLWQNHLIRVNDSVNGMKNAFTTLWQHHTARVSESMSKASGLFAKFKTSAINIFSSIGTGIKNAFGKISPFFANIFNGIANTAKTAMGKVKSTVSEAADILKQKFSSTNTGASKKSTSGSEAVDVSSIFSKAARGNERLQIDDIDLFTKTMDDLGKMDNAGVVKYIQGINDMGDAASNTQKAIAAYASSVQDGNYSVQAGTAFVDAHNAKIKASGAAAKIAAVGHGLLNAALSMGASILISVAIEAFSKLFSIIKDAINPVEKLSEDLSDLQSSLSDIRSELDTVNSELETIQERMAELIAMPSLSFVQQEELENLKKTNAELQRRQKLLKSEEERTEKRVDAKAAETVEAKLEETSYDGKWYDVVGNAANRALQGAISGAAIGFAAGGIGAIPMAIIGGITGAAAGVGEKLLGDRISTEDKLKEEIAGYDELIKEKERIEKELTTADDTKGKFLWWETDSEADKLREDLEEVEKEIAETEEYIDTTLSELGSDLESVDYGDGYDELLDFYYDTRDLWENMYGSEGAAANAIERIISQDQFSGLSNSIDKYVEKLKDGDESASKEIAKIINNSKEFSDALKKVGLDAQDAVDYFTLEEGMFDSDALEGVMNQYAHAISVMSELKDMGSGREFSIGKTKYNWDEFFTKNDVGEFEANAEKFSEILKGIDEDCRKTFMSLCEQVKNGQLTWEQAMSSFSSSGQLAGLQVIADQIVEINNIEFKNISDELSGVIDTFSEFGAALQEVASAMDVLNTAQTQMNSAGRISVLTALDIINATDRWNEILQIENGNIRLVGNATEVLVEDKIALIKSNLQNALSTVEEQLAMVEATDTSNEMAMTMEESTNQAVRQLAGSMAYLTTMTEAYTRAANGEKVDVDDYISKAQAAQQEALDALNWKVNSANKIGTAALEKKKEELEAQIAMLEGIDTVEEFKNNYDFEEKPGDKYDDDDKEDEDDALEKLRKKYENKIALLENQQTYLDNEIARMEANDEQVGTAIYEEQIRLENEKIKLYEEERAALLAQMNTVAKGSDEWYEHAEAVWEVEHAIQESTLAVLEYKQAMADLYIEAFNKIADAYDKEQELYGYQTTTIENRIELTELRGEPISADYYKQLTDIKQKERASALEEVESLRTALELGVNDEGVEFSDEELVDMIYRMYDAQDQAQQLEIDLENINEELKQLYITAFDKVKEAFDALDDLHSDRQSYVENYMEYMDLIGEDVGTDYYDYLISEENAKMEHNIAELAALEDKLTSAIENGSVEIGSEEWIEMESNIRDCEAAILDNKVALAKYNEELKQLYVDAFNEVKDGFNNLGDVYDDQKAFIESYIDYLEVLGVKVPEEMYEKLIEVEEQKKQANIEQLAALEAKLADMEAQGYTAEDEEWIQAQADIRAVEAAIWDSEVAMAEFNKTMREAEYEVFDEFTKRISDMLDELENVYDLFSDEDVATEDGAWTEEGIASLGLMYQKMAVAKKQVADYQEEIEKLNDEYKSGAISEQEYNDRLTDLKNSQWDAIGMYEDAKDAIVDINEARIDMIEEGIQKEIEAYEELIQLKKDELDAERDLYEFKKNIEDQTDDIASLERRIAAMSGSTDAATVAERTKLEAQLREARKGLDDTYYTHAMDSQSSALDDENESYVTSKEDYIELLRESLEDVEAVVASTMTQVLINADTILGELNGISGEYGITLSESLTSPWISAAEQAEAFKNSALAAEYDFAFQNGIFTGTINEQLDAMFGAGSTSATNFQFGVQGNIEAIRFTVETATSEMTANLQIPFETAMTYAQNTFSPSVIGQIEAVAAKAAEKNPATTTSLTKPWEDAEYAAHTFGNEAEDTLQKVASDAVKYDPTTALTTPPTEGGNAWDRFGTKVSGILNTMITNANNAATKIGDKMDDIISDAQKAANAIANTGTSGGENPKTTPTHTPTPEPDPEPEKKITGYRCMATVTVNGKEYQATAVGKTPASAKTTATQYLYEQLMKKYKDRDGNTDMAWSMWEKSWSKKVQHGACVPVYYAKGTTGTKKDEWAITDESWIGDEITLAANKTGHLQYLKKGSAVMPADISENLVEWGKLNPNEFGSDGNVSLINNQVLATKVDLNSESSLSASEATIPGFDTEAFRESTEVVDKLINKTAENIVESTTNAFADVSREHDIFTNDSITSIQDTYTLTKDTIIGTVENSVNALGTIRNLAETFEPALNANLTLPWINASQESSDFATAAGLHYNSLIQYVSDNNSVLETALSTPYMNLTGDNNGNEVYNFSQYAKASVDNIIEHADSSRGALKTSLSNGFNDAKLSISSWSETASKAIDDVIDGFTNSKTGLIKALNDTIAAAKKTKEAVESVPDYSGNSSSASSSGASVKSGSHYISSLGKNVTLSSNVTKWSGVATEALQKTGQYSYDNLLLLLYQMQTESSGNQNAINDWDINAKNGTPSKGLMQVIDPTFQSYALSGYNTDIYDPLSNIIASIRYTVSRYGSLKKGWKGHGYAKGTLGTKQNEWALTDEIGDELVMYATPEGTLSFMRAGSTVVPAEITKNLVEWGQLNPNTDMASAVQGVNLMTNYVNKPEVKLEFENLVHIDNCSQDSIKDVEKIVTEQLDKFTRKLNTNLRQFK